MCPVGGITNQQREDVWLKGVWKLAAESSAAATSLLGSPPPIGEASLHLAIDFFCLTEYFRRVALTTLV